MFSLKCLVFLASCMILAASSPVEVEDLYEPRAGALDGYEPVLSRHARSPEGGSVAVEYGKDQRGREASVQYNQNVYTSKDGRGTVDAYAQGSRNFDHNRNDYGGGIRGSWKF